MITISRFFFCFVLFFSVFSFVFWPTVFEFEFGFGFGLMKYNRIYIFFIYITVTVVKIFLFLILDVMHSFFSLFLFGSVSFFRLKFFDNNL